MPIARYQLEDGRVARFEVPEGTTPEQAQKLGSDYFANHPEEQPQEDQGIRDEAILEAGRAIVSGGVRAVAGGLLGTASIPFWGMEGAADIVKDIQSNAFQPETEGGKAAMQKIGELVKKGIDFANVSIGSLGSLGAWLVGKSEEEQQQVFEEIKAKGISQFLGDETLESTGSPALATLAHISPEATLSAVGVRAPKAVRIEREAAKNFNRSMRSSKSLIDVDSGLPQPGFQKALDKYDMDVGALIDDSANLPVIYSGDTPAKVVDAIVKKQIKNNATGKHLATVRANKAGDLIDDDLGNFAIKQGFRDSDIPSIKHANSSTRNEMKGMLAKQRAITADSGNVDKFRPSDHVGNAVMDQVNYVRGEARKLNKKLDSMASKELTVSGRNLIGDGDRLKGVPVNAARVERAVFEGLDGLNVKNLDEIMQNPSLNIFDEITKKDFFEGSLIMTDKTSQRIIKDVFKLLKYNPDGPIDALRAHNVKRSIDALVDFNKKSSQGLTESGRRFAKSIRHEINQTIREVSPKYAKVNDDLSMAIDSLNMMEDAVARKIDLFDANAAKAVGTDMRKLLSNYGSRQILENSLNKMDDTARALGGSFDVNVRQLNRFANVLDRRFGSAAENSFKGNIDAALDLNRLRSTSIREEVIEKGLVKPIVKKLKLGPTDQKAFDAMQKILNRGK